MIWDDPFQASWSFHIFVSLYITNNYYSYYFILYDVPLYYFRILFECIHIASMYFI